MTTTLLKTITFCFFTFSFFVSSAQTHDAPELILNNDLHYASSCHDKSFIATVNFRQSPVSYVWFKDGAVFAFSESNHLKLSEYGEYEVRITLKDQEYRSNVVRIERCPENETPAINHLTNSFITSPNPVICGSNTTANLQANPSDTGYTYQWYYSSTYSGTYNVISGALASTYTATNLGYYKVLVNDNQTAPALSTPFEVSSIVRATLSDLNGNSYTSIYVSPNTPVQLKLTFNGGEAPYSYRVYEGGLQKDRSVTSSNPHIFTVTADQNTLFTVSNIVSSCSPNTSAGANGQINVIVDSNTDFNFSSPPKTNVCAGETIDVPYTTSGTWQTNRSIELSLVNQNGNTVNNSYRWSIFNNPMKYTIPADLPQGSTYRLRANVEIPYIQSSKLSPYTLTVTQTGCSPRANISVYPSNVACGYIELSASPYNSQNTYKWYRNNVEISGATNSYYQARESGNYKVQIQNASTGYNSTSTSTFPITILGTNPEISSSNSALCGSYASATITSNISGSGNTYQWSRSELNNYTFSDIPGATTSSLNTNLTGLYKLVVFDGQCTLESNVLEITNTPVIRLTGNDNTSNSITVNQGQSTTLKAHFTGELPFLINVKNSDGTFEKTFYANTNPYSFTVTPNQSQHYYVSSGSNNCGNSQSSYNVRVDVAPTPSFTLNTPASTTVCSGDFIEIPYVPSGTWGSTRSFNAYLVSGNTQVSNSGFTSVTSNNNFSYYINPNIAAGTYKLKVYTNTPYIPNTIESSYSITISSSGCNTPQARVINNRLSQCNSPYLEAYPRGSYTYQWYRDGVLVSGSTNYYIYPYQTGSYTVTVSNGVDYTSTSQAVPVTIGNYSNNSTQTNESYCTSSSKTFTSLNLDPGNSYQWYYSSMSVGHTPISGANGSSYTATAPGSYLLVTTHSGGCESRYTYNCPVLLDFLSQSVCRGGSFTVPGYSSTSTEKRLKLLNATTGVEVADLGIINVNFGTFKSSFSLPTTVPAGTYKLKVVFGSYESPISQGTLTVLSTLSPSPPTLTATPDVILGPGNHQVTLTASGCSNQVVWEHTSSTASTQMVTLYQQGRTYKAYCKNSDGCNSSLAEVTVRFDCGDPFEPNNNQEEAHQIHGNYYTSPALCFESGLDQDWFLTVINGRKYFIRIKQYGGSPSNNPLTPYIFEKSLSGNVLTLETKPQGSSYYLDTELYLYNESGQQLAYNDDGNGSGFSKIVYSLANPCQTNVALTSPIFDVFPGETTTVRAQNIEGLNKIQDTSSSAYEASKSILLSPGFETQISSSGTFRVEIKNCP